MSRVFVKTALKTAIGIIIITIISLIVFNFAFPQHMATFNERVGNYPLAIHYSQKRYEQTGSTADLARCVDNSILAKDYDSIVLFGEELIDKADFESYAQSRDIVYPGFNYTLYYGQYVNGKIAIAKYHNGDIVGAIDVATSANGYISYVKQNALHALIVEVASNNDKETLTSLLTELEKINPLVASQIDDLNAIKEVLKDIIK